MFRYVDKDVKMEQYLIYVSMWEQIDTLEKVIIKMKYLRVNWKQITFKHVIMDGIYELIKAD